MKIDLYKVSCSFFVWVLVSNFLHAGNFSSETKFSFNVQVFPCSSDTDMDSLCDNWERQHFGSLTQEPTNDYDGDGYSNIREFKIGSSPIAYGLRLTKGWNLISIAGTPEDSSAESIFSGYDVSPLVWTWQNNRFEISNQLMPLRGYLVHFNGESVNVPINITDQIRQEFNNIKSYSLSLKSGWNLFSLSRIPNNNFATSIFSGTNINHPIWMLDNDRLKQPREIGSLQGYWIYLIKGDAMEVPIIIE